jgi:hypothetical protein
MGGKDKSLACGNQTPIPQTSNLWPNHCTDRDVPAMCSKVIYYSETSLIRNYNNSDNWLFFFAHYDHDNHTATIGKMQEKNRTKEEEKAK